MMRVLACLIAAPWSGAALAGETAPAPVRLYPLDCGRIDFTDMRVFADTGEHDGETAPCRSPVS